MILTPLFIVGSLGLFAGGLLVGFFFMGRSTFDEAGKKRKAEKSLAEAKEEADKLLQMTAEEIVKMREYTIAQINRLEAQNAKHETLLQSKEQLLKKKEERNNQNKQALDQEASMVALLRGKIKEIEQAIETSLFTRVGIPQAKAKEQIILHYVTQWEKDSIDHLHHFEKWLKEMASKMAKNILGDAIYRYADISSVDFREGEIVVEHDQLKGKLIGETGHILVLLEKLLDIDLVFNDAPNTISFSCFNLVNREIARITLSRLLKERRVTEEVVPRVHELAKSEMEKVLQDGGMEIVKKLGLRNIPVDLIKLVGRLNYRTSYGQNIMRHSLEVGFFARMLASEIGADENVAFLGGFFHDIGKSIDQEVGGSHDVLSKEILEKYGFPWEVVHAAWTHHDAIPQETIEAILVKAADAISAGRPGARAISLEQYLKKIKDLEESALSFEGVKKAYAISAGREVRAIVDPDTVTDTDTQKIATAIASKIEEKGGYPGKIKVTTIRLTKTSSMAKQKGARK